MDNREEGFLVEAEVLDDSDEKLHAFFQEIQKDSLKTLEDAARQIITLVTTLLGVFFGVLAFKDNPAFLNAVEAKVMGAISAGALFAGMFFALDVVIPRLINVPQSDLTAMRDLLQGLYKRKSRSLKWAQVAFGFGTFFFLGLILWLLLGV